MDLEHPPQPVTRPSAPGRLGRTPTRLLFGVLLSVAALVGTISAARAQQDWGASAYKGLPVASFEVHGVPGDIDGHLVRGLALARSHGVLRGGRPLFYPRVLSDDLRRCRLYLARRGYPHAVVTPRFALTRDGDGVRVTLDVDAGPPVVVLSVSVDGVPGGLEADSRDHLTVARGAVFADARVEETTSRLIALLREHGYAHAEVVARVERPDSTHAAIQFAVRSGARCYFGDTIVHGAPPDLVPLVRRTVEADRGEVYSPRTIARSRDNLRLLDLFRQVRVDTKAGRGDTLDVVVDLVPRQPRSFETALGFWTDDLLRGRARWEHRDLFGGGRGFSLGGSASRYQQLGNVSLWWPALVGARTRGGISGRVERQNEESYELTSIGLNVTLDYTISLQTALRTGIEVSSVNVNQTTTQPNAFVQQGGLLTVVSTRWSRDASDDRFDPTRGTVTWVELKWAPNGSVSDNHFVSAEASGTVYRTLVGSLVIAARSKAGVARPTGDSVDLLPNERFYSGGSTSMRGFKRHGLGPLDASGAPLGGEAEFEGSVELRFPILWRFRGALFVDTGQVWAHRTDVTLQDLQFAVGPGLRLMTPVGPLRTDLGYRVTDVATDQPRWVFHVAIGPAF